MNENVSKKEKKKGKFRFNFIDLLVLTLIVSVLLGTVVSAFYEGDEREELLLTLQLEEADLSQLVAAELTLAQGAKVYAADGDAVYGTLAKEYEKGEDTLTLRVFAEREGSDRFMAGVRLYIGQKVNVRCKELRGYGLTVKDITEVTGK